MIAAAAPALAGAVALMWPEPNRAMGPELAPRAVGALGIVAAMAATVWIALGTARDAIAPTAGLVADPWRAGLVLGALLGAGAWLVRRREANDVLVARLGLTSALVGGILAADGATAAAFIAAGSTCTIWLAVRGHLVPRTAAVVVVTDIALLLAIGARSLDGLSVPMDVAGVSGWVWVAAIVARVAIWSRSDDAGLALGYRMQALWFAYWITTGEIRSGLGLAAAALAVVGARRVARGGSASALGMTIAMLTTTAIAAGRSDLAPAVASLAAATAVVGVLVALGRPSGITVGLVPIGAALPGVLILATVSLRDLSIPGRLVALGVVGSACYLAAATGEMVRDPRVRARVGWALIPLAAGVAIAAVPRSVADAFAPGAGTLTEMALPIAQWFVPAVFLAVVLASFGAPDRIEQPEGPEVVTPTWSVSREHLLGAVIVVVLGGTMVVRGLLRGFL